MIRTIFCEKIAVIFYVCLYFFFFYSELANDYGRAIVTRTMRSPVVCVRADELEAGRRRVRIELRQKTEFQTVDGTQREGPRDRRVWQRGNRLGHGPQISSADVYVFVQSHGVWKLHGLLSGRPVISFCYVLPRPFRTQYKIMFVLKKNSMCSYCRRKKSKRQDVLSSLVVLNSDSFLTKIINYNRSSVYTFHTSAVLWYT